MVKLENAALILKNEKNICRWKLNKNILKFHFFQHCRIFNLRAKVSFILKFGDGEGPNLCRVKKYMLVPHLLKIYFGLG